MTDERSFFASLDGTELKGPSDTRTQLVLHCAQRFGEWGTTIAVHIGKMLDEHLNYRNDWAVYFYYRFGGEEFEERQMLEAPSFDVGFWFPGKNESQVLIWESGEWLSRMLNSERLRISVRTYDEGEIVTEFDLRDMRSGITELLDQCPA